MQGVAFCFFVCFVLSWLASASTQPGSPKLMITIVALGDSTTAGTPGFKSPIEAPPNGSGDIESQYAYWLSSTHPNWEVMNRGVNGERSDQIRKRFGRDVLQEK